MRIAGTSGETYLYLNGLSLERTVRLSENIELLPAQAECSADLFLGVGKSDIDISLISLFLPLVRSQMRVRGADGKDTAVRAWNAIWDALLLGALTNSDVMCNLQSDVPAEELHPGSIVRVTNYNLRGFSESSEHCLSDPEIAWIEQHLDKARRLLENESFANAVHCLASYRWHTMPRARLAILWSGIEGLFNVDSEVVFRVSLYAARFLASEDLVRQRVVFANVKRLYKLRSKAVHGARMKDDAHAGVQDSAELLKSLVVRCAEPGSLPDLSILVP